MAADPHRAILAAFDIERPKLIASLTRITRDIGTAEELAQDALVAALEEWPKRGTPEKPGAWLMLTAKRRALDAHRRKQMAAKKYDELGRELRDEEAQTPDLDAALDDDIGDDLLRLIFTACHPVLSPEARVALTLRLLGGLTTEEIARAFLVPEPTIAQRIVRAKRTIADASLPYEVPHGEELSERLAAVLEVIYLIFNEGYAATSGANWMRPQLCEEALRLGRVLAELAPAESEVHGLVALMEIQMSRFAARIGRDGEPVLLMDQNRARWDRLLIRRGLAALERARSAARALNRLPGSYFLQAELAACHARARSGEETDWAKIVGIYGALGQLTPSPVIELNRAVALGMLMGPEAGLEIVDALAKESALKNYYLLPAVRGDLLAKLKRHGEAKREFERAAAMTQNERERAVMQRRAKEATAKK
jgi:RNA polymerase sigma factor (sigma-70 family)